MLIFIWYHSHSKYGQSPEARPFIGFWWVWGRCRGARGAGVGAVRMSRDKVARHLSILCMSIAWALSALHWLPATCHRENCFVLIPFTGLASHKKRGFCLAEKKNWTYLAGDFSFQIWYSRTHFERLSDLSPNVCRRWLISYFLEKQTVRVVNFTHSYLWICFVSHFWLLSKSVL